MSRWATQGVGSRWLCLVPPPRSRSLHRRRAPRPAGAKTGICLDTSDVDADHATLKAAGVDVDDEVARWGGPVPPMFWLRDPDGNSLIVVQPTSSSRQRAQTGPSLL